MINSASRAITSDAASGDRFTVLLALPRADYVASYEPLVEALVASGDFRVAVAAPPDTGENLAAAAEVHHCRFYSAGAGLRWAAFALKRELAVRSIIRRVRPDVLVVPSDVSDALLGMVAAARRTRVAVAYVQGALVFPDYVARNAESDRTRLEARSPLRRVVWRAVAGAMNACGIHAVTGFKGAIGQHADWLFVVDETQRRIHESSASRHARILVTGAPFRDALASRARHFSDRDRLRVRTALGIDGGRVVVFFTKSLFRLGWATRDVHDELVRAVVATIRRELPDWWCVVKLHPAEDPADYRAIEGGPVRVVRDAAAEDLLLASDLSVSLGGSSPALAAPALGVPSVVVSPRGIPMLSAHDGTSDRVLVVHSMTELADTLRTAPSRGVARAAGDAHDGVTDSARIALDLRRLLSHG